MRVWLFFLIAFCTSSFTSGALAQECVVLLHGLARTHESMINLQSALTEQGYFVVNKTYPSREKPIPVLAQEAIPKSVALCPQNSAVHFVTHSMGGILVRQFLSAQSLERLGRVVMLGPPNQGSEVVDNLGEFPGFEFINGQAGMQLGTGPVSVPNTLGAANFDLGIIAGTRSINLILSMMIPGSDDGKVSVEHTKLTGMKDHLTLPVTHTFMMKNHGVIEQVLHYLKHGAFDKGLDEPAPAPPSNLKL